MLLYELLENDALLDLQDEDEEFHLPDFLRTDYPFDLPPYRRGFYQPVFEAAGAPRRCPSAKCRRSRRCLAGDGPPCYRADRARLGLLLQRVYLAFNYMEERDIARFAFAVEAAFGRTA